jgi:hypothetical protein
MVPKHGDLVFIHNQFTWGEPGTYMAPFIRGFLDIQDIKFGIPPIFYNHNGNIVEEDNDLWIYEAGYNTKKKKGEVIRTQWDEWVAHRNQGKYLIQYPTFQFDPHEYKKELNSVLGKPYDFNSVLIFEPIKLMTYKTIWLGKKGEKATNSFYCSKLASRAYYKATNSKLFTNWYKIDPAELFYLGLFKSYENQ